MRERKYRQLPRAYRCTFRSIGNLLTDGAGLTDRGQRRTRLAFEHRPLYSSDLLARHYLFTRLQPFRHALRLYMYQAP